jgi:hypothetical protein
LRIPGEACEEFSIEPGESSWVWTIQQAAVHCAFMIILIGSRWLTVVDGAGHPRLQGENDPGHREITAALDRNTTVIPVIVPGGAIPLVEQLP